MHFHQTTLDSGLEIIAETNESAYSVSLGFFVRSGSRNETTETAGVSHFLEHLVFKGTERVNAAEVNHRLDEMGADANAFTTEEQTVYFASLLPELFEDALDLFGEILRPALRADDVEMERQVILEEINMYEDQPPFGLDDKSRELFFQGHPLAGSVLGTMESVSGLSVEQLKQYLDSRYGPENIVLVAAGNIDFDGLVRKAKAVTKHWQSPPKRLNDEAGWRRQRGRRGLQRFYKDSITQQHTMLLSDGPSCRDADRHAAGLLAAMLGDDSGSRLFWDLVDTGLADSATMGTSEFFDNGAFITGLSSEPDEAEEVLLRTRNIYQEAMREGLTQEELDRAKNKLLSRLVLANELPSGRLFSIGGDWLARHEYRSVAQDIEELARIALDDIHAVLKKFPLDESLTVTIGPRRA